MNSKKTPGNSPILVKNVSNSYRQEDDIYIGIKKSGNNN